MHDFIVVGAGGYGAATAWHLSRSGASVLILEAKEAATGSSGGRGKRGVRGNRRDLCQANLISESYELWQDLANHLGSPTGFIRTNGIYLIEEEVHGIVGGTVAASVRAATQNRYGIETEVIGRDQIRKLLPQVNDKVRSGLLAHSDGMSSPSKTTAGYLQAAKRLGAELITRTSVKSLKSEPQGGSVLTTDGKRFYALKSILISSNAGVNDIFKASGIPQLPMWNVYPQALFVRTENTPKIPLLVGHDSRRLSVKTVEDGLVMLSGGWRGAFNSHTKRGEPTSNSIKGNMSELASSFPGLGQLELIDSDASRAESVSVDQLPYIGRVDDGLYVVAGNSGHGWAVLPAASKYLSESMLYEEQNENLAAFSPNRHTR